MPRVDFELDSPVHLPGFYTHHFLHDRHLLLAPDRPTWIALKDTEYLACQDLAEGRTVRMALEIHSEETVRGLLSKIHQAGFYREDRSYRRTYPPKLTLYITNRCNLQCVHCYASAGKPLPAELSPTDFIDAIEQYSEFVQNGEVTVSGGEPTLHPALGQILNAIKDQGHRSVLFTNGTTRGGKQGWEALGESADVIQLSLDGFDQTTNDAIRGKGSYSKILATFNALYRTQVQIRLSVCAMPQNVESLRQGLLPFLREFDPERKIGLILSPTVVAGRNQSGKYAFDYPELQEAIGDALDSAWQSGWRFPNTFQRNDCQPRCGIGSSILIAPDGAYRACTFAPVSGNFKEKAVRDWYRDTQAQLQCFNVENIPVCMNCDLRHICLGGCVIKMGHRAGCTGSGPCTYRQRRFYYEKLVRESKILFGERMTSTQTQPKGGETSEEEEGSPDRQGPEGADLRRLR